MDRLKRDAKEEEVLREEEVLARGMSAITALKQDIGPVSVPMETGVTSAISVVKMAIRSGIVKEILSLQLLER